MLSFHGQIEVRQVDTDLVEVVFIIYTYLHKKYALPFYINSSNWDSSSTRSASELSSFVEFTVPQSCRQS